MAVEGRGRTRIGADFVVEWQPRDIFVVPSWKPVVHEAADEAGPVLVLRSTRAGSAAALPRGASRCLNHRRAPSAAAERLTRTTEEILAEVQQLPAELIHWVPADGVWTVMDNLCHIREFVPFWTGETLRIVRAAPRPWGRDHTDTARLAAVTNTAAHRLDDVVADIREAVRRSDRDAEDAERRGPRRRSDEQEPALGREAGLVRRRGSAGAPRCEASGSDSPQRGAVQRGARQGLKSAFVEPRRRPQS